MHVQYYLLHKQVLKFPLKKIFQRKQTHMRLVKQKVVDVTAKVKTTAGAEAVFEEDFPEETDTHETGETKSG